MPSHIEAYEVHKIETPTGRIIGDNNCSYEVLDVVCICLKTADGRQAWGYGETCSRGTFTKTAWFIKPMVALGELQESFSQHWWPRLHNQPDAKTVMSINPARQKVSALTYLDVAVRMALWDLNAQQAGLPLWRLLGGKPGRNRVPAYGSILDFHLTDTEALSKVRDFLGLGMTTIKVKIGAFDISRDVDRLRLVTQALPQGCEVTADANIAWSATQTLRALQHFAAEGINLGYLEDPLPHDDLEGYRLLARARESGEISTPLVGHDYAATLPQLRRLLETEAISMVRNGSNLDQSIEVAQLARRFGVKMIFTNSMFELNVHPAAAFGKAVDRLEFSDLAWNGLMQNPIRFADGMGIAPEEIGHGLAPRSEILAGWSRPGSS